jgi:hypothetical protein
VRDLIAIGRRRHALLGAVLTLHCAAIAQLPREVIYTRVATVPEIAIAGGLVGVGGGLVAFGRRLVGIGRGLIAVRRRLVGILECLLAIGERLIVRGSAATSREQFVIVVARSVGGGRIA